MVVRQGHIELGGACGEQDKKKEGKTLNAEKSSGCKKTNKLYSSTNC